MSKEFQFQDITFIVETLMPEQRDPQRVAQHLQTHPGKLDALLDDERLLQRLMGDDESLVRISARLFFTILLRRVWRDLESKSFTTEQRNQQKVVLFDADKVVELLEQMPMRDYLATMLASFTRTSSVTTFVELRRGLWRAYKTHEFDVEGMARYSHSLDEAFRFPAYKRIADVCLFLASMFPEYIRGQHRYPASGKIRPRMRSRVLQSVEDYETFGRDTYRLAAQHEQAKRLGLGDVLNQLSEDFILAEKPLAFLGTHYLQFTRHRLFGTQ